MSDPNSPKEIAEKLKRQISEGLQWLHDRAWPLGAFSVAIAVLYLFNYINVENVPISITSADVLASMPGAFAVVILLIVLLTLAPLAPTMVLFTSPQNGGPSLVSHLTTQKTPERTKIVSRWLLALTLWGIFLSVITYLAAWVDSSTTRQWLAALGALGGVAMYMHILVIGRGNIREWKTIDASSSLMAFASGVLQLFSVLIVIVLSPKVLSGLDSRFLPLVYAPTLMLLGALQLLGATLISVIQKSDRPLHVIASTSAAIVVGLAFYQPASAWLIGKAIQITAMGGRSCVALEWTTEENASKEKPTTSDNVRVSNVKILWDTGDTYIVRSAAENSRSNDKRNVKRRPPSIFIPKASVRTFSDCT